MGVLGGCLYQYTHTCAITCVSSVHSGTELRGEGCAHFRGVSLSLPPSLSQDVCVFLEGQRGGPWPCGLHCPCVSVQALGVCRSHVSLCRPVGEGLNASLWGRPGACVDVDIVRVCPGFCLCWPRSLLATRRPASIRSPPPTSCNFSTLAPACWVLAEAEPGGREARGVLGLGCPRVSVRSGGEGESGRRAVLCS